MEVIASGIISVEAGLEGDCKGLKFPLRQITILSREMWEEALFALGNPDLPWTARRANLLVENVHLPCGPGSLIAIGPVRLEVTAETVPCAQMDHAYQGLRKALAPDCRGGVTCKVVEGGPIALGDEVRILGDVPKRRVHLPG